MSQTDSSQAPSLSRADKLIGKGSFAAAVAELRKLLAVVDDPDLRSAVQHRLEHCDLELRKQQAKEWIKRGRKSEKRGKLTDALSAFRQAQRLGEEPWMAPRISDLEAELEKQTLAAQGRRAEDAGQWQAAARLYAAAGAEAAHQKMRLIQARARLEAGDHAAAAEIYGRAGDLSKRDRYDWGYCHYRLGQLASCLEAWDGLSAPSPELVGQRDAVRRLLHDQVLAEFASAEEPGIELRPLAAYLHQIRPTEETETILYYYFLRRLESCWRERQLVALLDILDEETPLASTSIHQHPKLVEVYAKTGFKLAETSADHLPLLNLYYLTAVYRRRFSTKRTGEKVRPDDIRAMLIHLGDELVDGYRDGRDRGTQYNLRLWSLEKAITAELWSILPKNRVAVSQAICTPQFAWRFGCGPAVISLLEQNSHRARDLKTLLALGAYFTPYGPSLYAIELGTEAPAETARPRSEPQNEFERFALNKLCFFDGLSAVRAQRSPPRRFFHAALELFAIDDEDESRFLALAAKEQDPEMVDQYIEMLRQLCRARPRGEARTTLSRLMSQRASDQFFAGEISVKVFRNILHQTLQWDPDNEGARGALEDARLDQELVDLRRAFGRRKYDRFCQIARDTEFEEVHDTFWQLLADAAGTAHQLDPEFRPVALWELKRCVLTVDPDHPLMGRIDRMLGGHDAASTPR